jgi:flagellar basal-body rod modification protein FlgD
MSQIDNSNPFAALNTRTATDTAASTGARSSKLGQEQFLELMVAQIKNQDPTKPMDSSQFLGQMAQFGTVSGIQELQKSFSQMASSYQSNQALMASSMVGRSVLVPGSTGILPAGGALTGTADLPVSVAELTINITDSAGQQIRRLALGSKQAGEVKFSWDGLDDSGAPVAAGAYEVHAEAMLDGKNYAVDTAITAQVESVTLGGAKGMQLNLAGLGAVALSDVKQIS